MVLDKYQKGLELSGRWPTMLAALTELCKVKPEGATMIETGTTRQKDDWGAGMATLVFGDFAKAHAHTLYTVDINPYALTVAEDITKEFSSVITYVENDSVTFLKSFPKQIDFLYLDSMDCPEYDEPSSLRLLQSQIHQLLELDAAWNKLSDHPIILLDDNEFENGGKTRLSKVYLAERGFTEVMGGKQSLWIKS